MLSGDLNFSAPTQLIVFYAFFIAFVLEFLLSTSFYSLGAHVFWSSCSLLYLILILFNSLDLKVIFFITFLNKSAWEVDFFSGNMLVYFFSILTFDWYQSLNWLTKLVYNSSLKSFSFSIVLGNFIDLFEFVFDCCLFVICWFPCHLVFVCYFDRSLFLKFLFLKHLMSQFNTFSYWCIIDIFSSTVSIIMLLLFHFIKLLFLVLLFNFLTESSVSMSGTYQFIKLSM